MTVTPRPLRTQFLCAVGADIVAVDAVQPVAVLLSDAGAVLDVVSWAHLREPPSEWVWRNRRVAVKEDRLFVQDLPDGVPIALVAGAGRFAPSADVVTDDVVWRYPRLFSTETREIDDWVLGAERTGVRLRAWVEREGHRWDAEDGSSIVASVVTGPEVAVVAVRRGHVRPWEFRPVHDLVHLTADETGVVVAPIPLPDVTAHCWPVRAGTREAFDAYLPWSEDLARRIADSGCTDVRITVDGGAVDIAFARDGVRYLLHDEPLDELGRAVGLRYWGTGADDWGPLPSALVVE